MEILHYSEEHIRFRERLREFLSCQVTPHVEEFEREHLVPKEIWRRMGAEGFLCPMLDKEYGGLGGDFLYSVIVTEELVKTNHSGLAAHLHSDIIVPYIETFGNEDQKRKYLPGCADGTIVTAVAMTEPDAGSDLSSMRTSAVEEGSQVVISGAKTFISNGINCDLVVLAARDPGVDNAYQAISLYLVEDGTPGFNKGNKLDKMGMNSQDTAELFFSNCRIPMANRLGAKGQGFLMLMDKLQQERLVCAVGAVAAAEHIVSWTLDYCKKTPGNAAGKPILKNQASQFTMVEMLTEVKLARTFVDKLVADHMEGKSVVIETSMAKYWTTELTKRTADRCLDLVGDYGYREDCPLARAFRDVRVLSIFAGTNEIMKNIVAKFMGM